MTISTGHADSHNKGDKVDQCHSVWWPRTVARELVVAQSAARRLSGSPLRIMDKDERCVIAQFSRGRGCIVTAAGMVVVTYAAVPLYYAFCRATGYSGTPNRASAAPATTAERVITVHFDTNVDPGLPWSFEPEQRTAEVKIGIGGIGGCGIGENRLVFFRATNRSSSAIIGHAMFNVQPDNAAHYFNKIQCFCFTEQTLEGLKASRFPSPSSSPQQS